jgi:hypothetical protein
MRRVLRAKAVEVAEAEGGAQVAAEDVVVTVVGAEAAAVEDRAVAGAEAVIKKEFSFAPVRPCGSERVRPL